MNTVVLDPEKFAIKTEQFEGPLELLIELVEKRKLLINDISLAAVTDEYMARVSEMQERSLPNTAQFITLAATLLLIKSKSLLPVLELTEEEESNIEDLEERLKRYQLYRDAAEDLARHFGTTYMHESQFVSKREPVFTPDSYCELETLNTTLADLLQNLPQPKQKPSVKVRPTITIEAMIDRIRARVTQQMITRFSDIRRQESEHKNVIVGFLAILELVKQGDVLVAQQARFADIEVSAERQETPQYY
jgi:segregation and condensation protein A